MVLKEAGRAGDRLREPPLPAQPAAGMPGSQLPLLRRGGNMYYKDRLIAAFARRACKAVSARVIRELQKMTRGMQSGDDSGLRNIWDEVCVQVQGEESVMWELYTDTIEDIIRTEVEKLDKETVASVWLQTGEGDDWADEVEDEYEAGEIEAPDKVDYNTDDVARYILHEYVLSEAADWTNRRIERYLSGGYGW